MQTLSRTYPSLYYTFAYKFGNPPKLAEFVMIDTIVLCGNVWENAKKGKIVAPPNQRDANRQWKWIKKQLQNSRSYLLYSIMTF